MLKIMNATKSFAGDFEATLKGIDLTLSPGEFCIVIGSNGSGKSTLLRCVSGEYSLDKGSVSKHKISVVSQDINKGTVPEMTCLENMMLSSMQNRTASFNFYQQYELEVIAKLKELNMGLESYINKPLSSMSGGQRQMVATLMAINANPEVLLLDEHTSALDPKTQKLLMDYTVANILNNKITTMMVTHKLEDAVAYGDRLIMMHKGTIILDVKNKEKRSLNIDDLFKLFHDCEVNHG